MEVRHFGRIMANDNGTISTMNMFPWHLLLVTLAGWNNQHQLKIIEYQQEEIRVLRELHGKRRLRFTDDQRHRLAAKGKRLGRKLLREFATIVKPDTIIRWHHTLIARKWDYSSKR